MYNFSVQKDTDADDSEFIEALEKAYARLDKMLVEQEKIEKHRLEVDRAVAKLAQKILQLAVLCDDVPKGLSTDRLKKSIKDLGITDAVREVIKGAERPLTVTEVKDRLEQIGLPVEYQNVGAVFNIVLKRLAENGEIKELPGKAKRTYVWIPTEPQTIYKPRPSALGRSANDGESK